MWNYEWTSSYSKKKSYRYFLDTPPLIVDHRVIHINPDSKPEQTIFPDNHIVSKKYTMWNFIPKNLFEQFRQLANFYFLTMAITSVSIKSPISPITSILPLTIVIVVTACKQGFEDYNRYVNDKRENRTFVTVIRNKCVQNIYRENIVVGDLVKIYREEDIPCDLLLLYSTEDSECCYITTSNLDGETNLKTVAIPKVLSNMSMQQIISLNAIVTCQHPSSNLYSFHGKMEIKDENNETIRSGYLMINNLLLRGSRLKDTDYIIGCAIYTGHDTKLSLNSKITSKKMSTSEKSNNKYIVCFLIILLFEVIESCTMKAVLEESWSESWSSYLNDIQSFTFSSLVTDFLSFLILYNYIVPISLYVSIELQKFFGSFFFSWDIDMYDEDTDQPALIHTLNLNEELGQIEYLFADKTGTLTENMMVFRRCSINGKMYMEKDCDGKLYLLPPSGDENQAVVLNTWEPEHWHFMISIALCHTVQISPLSQKASVILKRKEFRKSFKQKKILHVDSSLLMHPDLPEYQATSADEKALVEACARCGVVFESRKNDTIELKIQNKILTYKVLEILEFTSERKRMSVLVKDSAGDYWLYSKGADSTMLPIIIEGKINEVITHVTDFSMRGFRTLVIGYKKINEKKYNKFSNELEKARQIIGIERSKYVEQIYNAIERDLTLLGATAIEDRLQEGVSETLESLQVAGIKVWILTGDKAETAENIAYLCGQFKNGIEVLKLLEIREKETCLHELTDYERRLKLEPSKQFGLLIDGQSLEVAIKNYADEFRSIAMVCDAVVCCRLSPLQKSEIVKLIKKAKSRPHTAAIGDGGNDVSMIQEAHAGIGIIGKEGRQAAINSDFAIAKFKFLKKALFVHGHWYYIRTANLTQYFFYKNLILMIPQFIFSIFCGFSTQVKPKFQNGYLYNGFLFLSYFIYLQSFFDALYLMSYNVIFTSFPIMMYGLFEQNYSADTLLRKPYLYRLNQGNCLLSMQQLFLWIFLGSWHAIVIFFMPYTYILINPVTLYNNTPIEQWTFSILVFHLVTLIANLQILLRSSYWTIPLILVVLFSQLIFVAFAVTHSFIPIDNVLTCHSFGDTILYYENPNEIILHRGTSIFYEIGKLSFVLYRT
ncbi:phospholipid-transporting ATPase IF-like isoform X4 [Apis cerana]|uniref:phospholipid-transporting ATPase IF-like isoform X4 n=1 Tax=Apis cerana TaxID=7461 RepID=UPI002B222456|nr:phospholipid-transporting ATPase IF-like isoform X4 [Apis cerana]